MSGRSKRPEVVNGYKAGDVVGIKKVGSGSFLALEKYTIRRVGPAGFLVKGLATCFYWHEKKTTWDDILKGV